MNNEELEKILDIKNQIEEKRKEIRKITNPEDFEKLKKENKDALNIINKEVHVTRGRLLKIYKMNRGYIEDLYDKYDMYINIYNILNRVENDNYSRTDKINDLKNSMVKKEYTQFEESILQVIQSNLDDLDKMMKELNELDDNHGIRDLIELKETYNEELKRHRENIDSRYKNEFLRKKATIPTIFTVLPKAIGLACKKVANCIKERKEAKTNKAKFNKVMKTMGAIGQVVATPVIYAGKFVIDHWYLLLLLLLALPKFSWWPFGKKKEKDKEKESDDGELQHQEQEATVPEAEKEPVLIGEKEPEGVPLPVPEAQPKPAIDYANDPRFQAKPAVQADPKPAIDYASDPRFQAQPEKVPEVEPKPAIDYASDPRFQAQPIEVPEVQPKPAIDYASDPRFQAQPEKVPEVQPKPAIDYASDPRFQAQPEKAPEAQPKPAIDYANDPRFQAQPEKAQQVATQEGAKMSADEIEAVDEVTHSFVENLQENNNFVVGSAHPEITVVHSAEEYAEFLRDSAYKDIPIEDAEEFYVRNVTSLRGIDRTVIWPEVEAKLPEEYIPVRYYENEQELANAIANGEDKELSYYFYQYAENQAKGNIFDRIANAYNNSGYPEYMEKIGIGGTGALVLFCLYEAAQYSLAIPTGGASLALPF